MEGCSSAVTAGHLVANDRRLLAISSLAQSTALRSARITVDPSFNAIDRSRRTEPSRTGVPTTATARRLLKGGLRSGRYATVS
jgi:hypothetical protein